MALVTKLNKIREDFESNYDFFLLANSKWLIKLAALIELVTFLESI